MDHISILQTIGYGIYLLLIIGTVLVVLTRNQNPVKTLAWLTVLIFVPMLGLIFYYFFGQDTRKQRIVARRYYDKIRNLSFNDLLCDDSVEIAADYANLVRLLKSNNHSPVLYGSRVEIFTSGERMFEALIRDMENAKNHIHIEFFIFNDDETGRLVKTVLMKKALQGLKVRFIYDNVANWKVPRKFYYEMQEAGVQVASLMETRFPLFQSSKINYRNHRKVLVIDGCIGYTGGMNVSNDYSIDPHWEDRHLRIEGMGALGLQANFMIDWYSAGKHWTNTAGYFPQVPVYTQNRMQIVTGGPYSEYSNLLQATISIVLSVKKYLYLQTPYFLPTDTLFEALQIACLSGIDVRLMVSKKSDSSYIDPAAHSYYENLLKAGMRIYEIQDRFIHAKTIVADDYISVVGSCNLDFRSLETNFEINCYMYDSDLAAKSKAIFFNNLKHCKEINYNRWIKRSRWKRLLESVMRLFAPLM
ncbi:MAG: cardiolipin synthase [Dysgonamonadaceae bacterium]|jgi:cardiolipin synthase|nr:cardiolipin synthase [Dysgonamonadaceae bacterium]